MKIHNILEAINYAKSDPKPEQSVVDKFAGVADSQRSYYINKWAEEKGIDSDDAMFMAGYVQDGYIGAGAWNWRYVGMDESIEEKTNPMIMNRDGKEIELTKSGDSMSPSFHLKVDGQDHGTFDSEKKAMQHFAKLKEEDEMDSFKGSTKDGHNYRAVGDDQDASQYLKVFYGNGKYFRIYYDSNVGRYAPDQVAPETNDPRAEEVFADLPDDFFKKYGSEGEKGLEDIIDMIKSASESIEMEEAEQEMIGEPDRYYDAEERTEAYNQLQDILQGNFMDDYIRDGVCPECAGSGYMDGEETFTNDDGEEEESSECMGFGNYGCDEGEMTYRDDTVAWKAIADHDYNQEIKAERESKPQPSDEILLGAIEQLHKNYVKTGRFNAFELPSILRQMYPEISKQKARQIGSEFLGSFKEVEEVEEVERIKELAGLEENTKEGDSGEAMVAKMLAKALGDENRWTDMSAPELHAELESENSYLADMIKYLAKMLYDVKLQERAYKDVGVADTVKDQRGKEFQFDKSTKKFKSQDGEEADVKTKLGKDLMRIRKNQMKKTSPSYKTKKNQGRPVMASIEESYGDAHEITLEDNEDFNDIFGVLGYSLCEQDTFEAEYQGRKVKLNKPMQGDVKKFKVYVKDPKTGNVKKVNFGHGGSSAKGKTMKIRKSNPKARKSFRARHNCDNPGPKTKARYWSCRKW